MTGRPDLIVMRDPDDDRWIRIKGPQQWGRVLEGARVLLKQHHAEYLGDDRGVWLAPAAAWPRLAADLEEHGFICAHRTLSDGGGASRPVALECRSCGQPYRAGAPEGRPCVVCGAWLVLVPTPGPRDG